MQQLLGAGCRSIQVRLNDFKTNANDSMPRKLQLKVNYFVHSRLKIRKAANSKITMNARVYLNSYLKASQIKTNCKYPS